MICSSSDPVFRQRRQWSELHPRGHPGGALFRCPAQHNTRISEPLLLSEAPVLFARAAGRICNRSKGHPDSRSSSMPVIREPQRQKRRVAAVTEAQHRSLRLFCSLVESIAGIIGEYDVCVVE